MRPKVDCCINKSDTQVFNDGDEVIVVVRREAARTNENFVQRLGGMSEGTRASSGARLNLLFAELASETHFNYGWNLRVRHYDSSFGNRACNDYVWYVRAFLDLFEPLGVFRF